MFSSPRLPDRHIPRYPSNASLLASVARPVRGLLALCFAVEIMLLAAMAALPWLLGRTVDRLTAGDGLAHTWPYTAGMAALVAVIAVGAYATHTTAVMLWMRSALAVSSDIGHRISRVGPGLSRRKTTGEVVAVLQSDATRLGAMFEMTGETAASVVVVLTLLAVMFATNAALATVVAIGVPIMLAAIAVFGKMLHTFQGAQREQVGRLTALASDGIAGLRILRGVGGEELFMNRYRAQSEATRAAGVRVGYATAPLSALQELLPNLLVAVVLWFGVRGVQDGNLSAGDLIAFLGYTAFLVQPFTTFGGVFTVITRGWVAATRIREVLNLPHAADLAPTDDPATQPLGGDLVDPATGIAARAGELTVCVSPRPSLTAAALRRFARLDPEADETATGAPPATVGGVPLSRYTLEQIRAHVALADSTPQLMSGTLRSQLDPLGEHSDDEIHAALRVACADDILDLLPEGLGDYVTERGRSLSGGQRQRIALARAVLRDPAVLVLIEPTSAVDAHTEAAIASRLAEHRAGKTTIISSASPLVLAVSDRVVFCSGLAADETPRVGTHAHLSTNDSDYRRTVLRTEQATA